MNYYRYLNSVKIFLIFMLVQFKLQMKLFLLFLAQKLLQDQLKGQEIQLHNLPETLNQHLTCALSID